MKKYKREEEVHLYNEFTNGEPRYITRKPNFSCPVSPAIAWHWGLQYAECPLVEEERDMGECANCPNRSFNTLKLINKRKNKNNKRKRKNNNESNISIPKKGKTYISQ